MVCDKCELKLKHVVTPDPWKMGGELKIVNIVKNKYFKIKQQFQEDQQPVKKRNKKLEPQEDEKSTKTKLSHRVE